MTMNRNDLVKFFVEHKLKITTAKIYSSALFRLYNSTQHVRSSVIPNDTAWITKKIITDILEDADTKTTTKRNLLSALIAYKKILSETNDKIFYLASTERDNFQKEYELGAGKWNKDELNKIIEFDELANAYDKIAEQLRKSGLIGSKKTDLSHLSKGSSNYFRDLLIMAYYLYPFRYPNEWSPMRNDLASFYIGDITQKKMNVNNLPRDKNYIFLNSYKAKGPSKIIIFNSKNRDSSDPPSIIELPRGLSSLLVNYANAFNIPVGEKIINVTKNQITDILGRYGLKFLGKRLGTQILRKIYMSHKYGNVKEEEEKDAEIMGHSVETGRKFYIKEKTPTQ